MDFNVDAIKDSMDILESFLYRDGELTEKDAEIIYNTLADILENVE